jgi:hypothetical protein
VVKTKFELADVVQRFGKQLLEREKLSPIQTKALHNILQCRTAALGGHEEHCNSCEAVRYSYNSCGDRNCPKCLAAKQLVWVEKLMEKTLAVNHFHIVFTVPHCLNDICLWNDRLYYKILFSAVWRTLHSFGYSHYGVESGAVAILHSWGQNLSLHPHIHCLVPAAGYSIKGQWNNIGKGAKYLYPVHQLSQTFKGKFIDSLKRELRKVNKLVDFNTDIQKAYNCNWVVNSQPSLAKAAHVIRYLGQYTHRVAISNDRILNISDTHVTFIAKDYRDNAIKKPVTLSGVEFLRRFCMHILPYRFVKIRYYGIYNHTTKRNLALQFTPLTIEDIEKKSKPKESAQQSIHRIIGRDVRQCHVCKKGIMRRIRELPRIRSPNRNLPSLLFAKLL